ncbi:hypothetical protein ONZ45_g6576 [Pleurotus djamor]|nr:hypothetical protein ONZ45_g6576 [Pleurotus djamor]
MSEYWVSHKKFFCKFCNIYIADDAPSRQQHENGLRHKGNKERFVRGLYKAGEKRKKDLDEEKLEIARVEKAAQAAYAQDIGAGHAKQSPSAAGPSSSSKPPPPKPSNPYANYSTAASLGFTDPDAEKLAAEVERRRTQGVVGDWEYVAPQENAASSAEQEEPLKREAEHSIDDERHFKIRKKTLNVGLGEIYDPGLIPIKLKAKEPSPPPQTQQSASRPLDNPEATNVPKWTKVQWKKAGEQVQDSNTQTSTEQKVQETAQIKKEDTPPPIVSSETPTKLEPNEPVVKAEDPPPPAPSTGLFKKRRRPGQS